MQFERYAKLYDVINNHKDYETEANYFMDLSVFGDNKCALEIGSGTGRHAEFFEKKLKLVCVEKSRDMAILARNRVVSKVIEGDFTTVEIPEQKFDVVFCLFHVLNYFTENEDLENFFSKVSQCLKPNGKFVCDFWHTPAVYSIGPSSRIVRKEFNGMVVKRKSVPTVDLIRNIVSVDFHFEVFDITKKNKIYEFNETHMMRPFSIPEINLLATSVGLYSEAYYKNMSKSMPTLEDWDVSAIFRKRNYG